LHLTEKHTDHDRTTLFSPSLTPLVLPERKLVQAVKNIVRDDVFRSVRLGDVLGSSITVSSWHGSFTTNPPSRFSPAGSSLYYLWGKQLRAFGKRIRPESLPAGRICIEILSSELRFKRFWQPIVEQLGADRCLFVLANRRLRLELPSSYVTVALDEIPVDWSDLRRWLLPRYARWRQQLKNATTDFGLNTSSVKQLLNILIVQTIRISASHELGKGLQPTAFLSTWDQSSIGAPLCAALRSQGIPTYTLVHAAIGRQSLPEFVPLNAQYVMVWGETQRELFLDAGVEDSRIIVTGCQRSRLGTLPQREVNEQNLQRLGLSSEKRTIVVSFTLLMHDQWSIWVQAVCQFANALPDIQVVCRLHPSHQRADYATLADTVQLRVIESSVLNLEECIAIADAVIVDSSTSGFDALLQGKLVAVLDPYPTPKNQDVMLEVIESNSCLYSRSPIDLAEQLKHLWSDDAELDLLRKRATSFISRYISAYDEEAAEKVVECITKLP
jgi:hypothetical protein